LWGAFRRVRHFCLPVAFVASPDLHGRFKCCPDSHSTGTSAFLSTCLAMFCTSATFTATAFPSPSPPCHFLCTSHIPSLAFLPHLLLPTRISICFPDWVVPINVLWSGPRNLSSRSPPASISSGNLRCSGFIVMGLDRAPLFLPALWTSTPLIGSLMMSLTSPFMVGSMAGVGMISNTWGCSQVCVGVALCPVSILCSLLLHPGEGGKRSVICLKETCDSEGL
jgi:hypothetical protein